MHLCTIRKNDDKSISLSQIQLFEVIFNATKCNTSIINVHMGTTLAINWKMDMVFGNSYMLLIEKHKKFSKSENYTKYYSWL